jgi:hypothetical protein
MIARAAGAFAGGAPDKRLPFNRIREHHRRGPVGFRLAMSRGALHERRWPPASPGDVMTVKILPNEKGNPPGKLADAELYFTEGPLQGLKLIGFGIWERKTGTGRNVTFPARQYTVNGERRSFALLRPIEDATSQERIRELILQAYVEHEGAAIGA